MTYTSSFFQLQSWGGENPLNWSCSSTNTLFFVDGPFSARRNDSELQRRGSDEQLRVFFASSVSLAGWRVEAHLARPSPLRFLLPRNIAFIPLCPGLPVEGMLLPHLKILRAVVLSDSTNFRSRYGLSFWKRRSFFPLDNQY